MWFVYFLNQSFDKKMAPLWKKHFHAVWCKRLQIEKGHLDEWQKQGKQILRILFFKKKAENIFFQKKNFQRQNDDKTLSLRNLWNRVFNLCSATFWQLFQTSIIIQKAKLLCSSRFYQIINNVPCIRNQVEDHCSKMLNVKSICQIRDKSPASKLGSIW